MAASLLPPLPAVRGALRRLALAAPALAPTPAAVAGIPAAPRRRSLATGPVYVRTADTTAAGAMEAALTSKPGARPGKAPGSRESLAQLVKRPADSFTVCELPFGRDRALRDAYVNFRGELRVGKLLEELDSFAGSIAYRHVDDGETEMPTLVTASFDRLDLLTYPLRSDLDMQLRGMVTYVGASSLNIDMELVALPPGGSAAPTPVVPVMAASTTFVARNSRTGRATPVPRLRPDTPTEQRLFEAGRLASDARKAARGRGLDRTPPTPEELGMVHALFQELSARQAAAAAGGGGVVLMEDTLLTSTELTMPQDRNVHGAWGSGRGGGGRAGGRGGGAAAPAPTSPQWEQAALHRARPRCFNQIPMSAVPAHPPSPPPTPHPPPVCRQGVRRVADAPGV